MSFFHNSWNISFHQKIIKTRNYNRPQHYNKEIWGENLAAKNGNTMRLSGTYHERLVNKINTKTYLSKQHKRLKIKDINNKTTRRYYDKESKCKE